MITHNGKGGYNAGAWLVVYTRKDSLDAREVLQANEQTCHTVSDALEDLQGSLSDIVAETPSVRNWVRSFERPANAIAVKISLCLIPDEVTRRGTSDSWVEILLKLTDPRRRRRPHEIECMSGKGAMRS